MDLVLWWLGLSVLAGVLAGNKGRSVFLSMWLRYPKKSIAGLARIAIARL